MCIENEQKHFNKITVLEAPQYLAFLLIKSLINRKKIINYRNFISYLLLIYIFFSKFSNPIKELKRPYFAFRL